MADHQWWINFYSGVRHQAANKRDYNAAIGKTDRMLEAQERIDWLDKKIASLEQAAEKKNTLYHDKYLRNKSDKHHKHRR